MAAKQLVGILEPYVQGENFIEYLERMEIYFELNSLEEDKFKVLLLCNVVGADACSKLRRACLPKKPQELKYKEVIEKCKSLFAPPSKACTNAIKFGRRYQKECEKVNDYGVELMMMAEACDFGEYKGKAIRNQFIMGLKDKRMKADLMALDDKCEWKAVLDKAVAIETVEKDLLQMENGSQSRLNYVDRGTYFQRGHRGNGRSRSFSRGRFPSQQQGTSRGEDLRRETKCYVCQGVGHIAKVCPSAKSRGYQHNSRSKFYHYNNRCRNSNNYNNKNNFVTQERGYVSNNHVDINDEILENVNFGNLKLNEVNEDNRIDNIGLSLGEGNYSEISDDDITQTDFHLKLGCDGNVNVNSVENFDTIFKVAKVEYIKVVIEKHERYMEIDTGACVSLCTLVDYYKYFAHLKIDEVGIPLSVLTGEKIKVMGKIGVNIKLSENEISNKAELIIIDTPKRMSMLCGRDWLDVLVPHWRNLFRINLIDECSDFRDKMLPQVKTKFRKLFDGDLSKPIEEFEINLNLVEGCVPIFHKAYTLPFNCRDLVEKELSSLENDSIIERVELSEWASPIVVVPKPNNKIRLCVDFSVTVNKFIKSQYYPLPVIDEVLSGLVGCRYFILLDLKGAYTQLKLSSSAQKVMTINTHKGLYMYKRLPYGLKPAAAIFQSIMDQILKNIPKTYCYIDDILIGAETLDKLYDRLVMVLTRLKDFNVKVNFEKCKFFVERLTYLGHEVSAQGLGPSKGKIQAIVDAPHPSNQSQLKSFVGLLNYYGKFMPCLSRKCSVFYRLLQKGVEWNWDHKCMERFEECKNDILNSTILEYYDPKKEIIIVCDASDEGLSGIMCHIVNGVEKPVIFASRTLTSTEKNYPILHREALAIVFAMEKFYKYIFGRRVSVYTDHKPLVGIFSEKKGQAAVLVTRLQRYVNRLAIFDFTVKYRKGADNGNADCLSRIPIKDIISEEDLVEEHRMEINLIEEENSISLNIELIRNETRKDTFLQEVISCVKKGFELSNLKSKLKNYYSKYEFLSVEKDCLLYRSRLVVPKSIKDIVLKLLHMNHCGIVKMKILARRYVFWEGMEKDIAKFVNECEPCQLTRNEKSNKIFTSWPECDRPFERVHVDFFHFYGKEFLILIDSYSRWMEVVQMNGTNAYKVGEQLENIFRIFGFPDTLVSDNGPPFGSEYFGRFCEEKGIKLIHTPPYHPESNGQAERAVQTAKATLKRFILEKNIVGYSFDLTKVVRKFLFNYNNLPCTEKNYVPSHKIFSFEPKICLDRIKLNNQESQNWYYNKLSEKKITFDVNKNKECTNIGKKKVDEFKKGENVLYLMQDNNHAKWVKAQVVERESNFIYIIKIESMTKRAHINQLKKCMLKYTNEIAMENVRGRVTNGKCEQENLLTRDSNIVNSEKESVVNDNTDRLLRRPERDRRPPQRFNDYIL